MWRFALLLMVVAPLAGGVNAQNRGVQRDEYEVEKEARGPAKLNERTNHHYNHGGNARHKEKRRYNTHHNKNYRHDHQPKRRHHHPSRHRHYRPKRYHWRHYHPRRYYYHSGPAFGFYIRIPVIQWFHRAPRRRYVYRQVVSTTINGSYYSTTGLDIRTTFERRTRDVRHDRVDVEFEIKSIEIWDGDRFVGVIDHLPKHLRRVNARVYNDGFVDFDRMVYVIGDPDTGFEVVSLRYSGLGTESSYADLDVRAGAVDFGRREVYAIEHSPRINNRPASSTF